MGTLPSPRVSLKEGKPEAEARKMGRWGLRRDPSCFQMDLLLDTLEGGELTPRKRGKERRCRSEPRSSGFEV